MVDRALSWVWWRIETSTTVPARSLGIFRWVFGAYLLVFDARWFAWLDRTPDAFFDPPVFSLAYLVGRFPPPPFFTVVDIVGLLALCAMTVGYRTRAMTVTALLTYLVSSTFNYSHGKVSHQIAIVLILGCMAVADWGKASPRRVAQGMSLLAVSICFGFLAAGLEKARFWLTTDLGVSGILSWYYPRMDLDAPRLLAPFVPGTPLWLLKIADFSAVLMELSGFAALLSGRIAWRTWLLVLPTFHLANTLILNITFPTQVVGYLVFIDLAAVFVLKGERLRRARTLGAVLLIAVTSWHVVTRVAGGGSFHVLGGSAAQLVTADIVVSICACLTVIALVARDLLAEVAAARARRTTAGRARPSPVAS